MTRIRHKPFITCTDAALEYVDGMLSSDTDWERLKPVAGCPRVHFNNDDRDALRLLSEEVRRLREVVAQMGKTNGPEGAS